MKFKWFIAVPLISLLLVSCGESKPETKDLPSVDVSYTIKDYSANSFYQLDSFKSSGNCKVLVVPVLFSDSPTYVTNNLTTISSKIEQAFFGTSNGSSETVKTYYETLSNNKITYSGTVTSWYNCGYTIAQIGTGSVDYTNILSGITTQYSSVLKDYDGDGDGYVDGIVMVYGALNYVNGESRISRSYANYSDLWAFCSWTQASKGTTSNPSVNTHMFLSYDFLISSDDNTLKGYGDTYNCEVDTHVPVHETGHFFGLQDYYSYSTVSEGQEREKPAGSTSMQDSNVCAHDPYSVMALGWADIKLINESVTINLKPFQSSRQIAVICPSWNSSPFDEMLVIEYYTPTGLNYYDTAHRYKNAYPLGVNSSGIRIWHVDNRLMYNVTSTSGYGPTNYIHTGSKHDYVTSNTGSGSHASDFPAYRKYRTLQLISNSTSDTTYRTKEFSTRDLFYSGSTFSSSNQYGQFVNGGKFNNGKNFGYKITVNSINSESAEISFYKE